MYTLGLLGCCVKPRRPSGECRIRRRTEGGRKEEGRKKRSVRKVHGLDGGASLERALLMPSRGRGMRRKKKRDAQVKSGNPRRDQAWAGGEDGFFSFVCWDRACWV